MAPSAETPTQIQPTAPAPPSGGSVDGAATRERTPSAGGPGVPPRPPERPTGGSGGGSGEDGDPGGGDDARKRLAFAVGGIGLIALIVLFVVLSGGNGNDSRTTPENLPIATQRSTPASTPNGAPKTPNAATASSGAAASTPTATSADGSGSGGVAVDGTATTPAASTPSDVPVLKAGSVTKIKVNQGDTVAFQVTSPTAQEVHVHGYDYKYELAAGQTKTITFPAKISGIFDIEFEATSTQIGELTVEP